MKLERMPPVWDERGGQGHALATFADTMPSRLYAVGMAWVTFDPGTLAIRSTEGVRLEADSDAVDVAGLWSEDADLFRRSVAAGGHVAICG